MQFPTNPNLFLGFLANLRDPMLAKGWGQIVTPLFVQTPGGRQKMNFSTMKGIFRIIQAITSPKAEPFKQWIAQVASERLDQMQDPEKSIDQAIVDYKRLGYSDAWINQRIKSIEVRKELTDEWQRTGVHEGLEYASLTDIITREWSGFPTNSNLFLGFLANLNKNHYLCRQILLLISN